MKKEVLDKTSKYEIAVEQDGPPLLSDLIKSAIPSKQGLYPHELIILEYTPKRAQRKTRANFCGLISVEKPQLFMYHATLIYTTREVKSIVIL